MIDYEMCIALLKEEIEKKGKIQLTIHGDSMLPTLHNGDKIDINRCDNNLYKIGDIIAYYIYGVNIKIVIHRIVFVRKRYVLTKGDNNNFIDPIKVDCNNILGKIYLN